MHLRMQQILLKHLLSDHKLDTEGNCEETAIASEGQKAPCESYIRTGKKSIAGEQQPIQMTKETELQDKTVQLA